MQWIFAKENHIAMLWEPVYCWLRGMLYSKLPWKPTWSWTQSSLCELSGKELGQETVVSCLHGHIISEGPQLCFIAQPVVLPLKYMRVFVAPALGEWWSVHKATTHLMRQEVHSFYTNVLHLWPIPGTQHLCRAFKDNAGIVPDFKEIMIWWVEPE